MRESAVLPPARRSGCSGTGCQGVPPAPPIFATPASATFTGVRNLAPRAPANDGQTPKAKTAKCRHGKMRQGNKCIKKKIKGAKKAKRASRDRRASS